MNEDDLEFFFLEKSGFSDTTCDRYRRVLVLFLSEVEAVANLTPAGLARWLAKETGTGFSLLCQQFPL